MLKKLANGEYSLKVIFLVFGIFGIFIFNLITAITHNGVLRAICPYGKICSKNVVLYFFSNFAILMTSNGRLITPLALHFIASACFICYVIILLRGLWKKEETYEGKKFWMFCAKWTMVCWALFSLKFIF